MLCPWTAPENLIAAKYLYMKYCEASGSRYFVDQSHPNIWHVEYWASIFPHATFLGIQRCPYSVVASMLKHDGVRRWVEEWEKFPLPNRLLGVNEGNKEHYQKMTLTERCALRWICHYIRLGEITKAMPSSVCLIEYEKLCRSPDVVLQGVAKHVGLPFNFGDIKVDLAPLHKNKSLDSAQVDSIHKMLIDYGIEDKWKHKLQS